jgi:predicted nucleotidyltransferase
MKTFQEIEKIIKKNRPELENKFGLQKIGIFGSYVRGEQNEESNLDLLVEIKRPAGMIKFLKLENYLSAIYERHVI